MKKYLEIYDKLKKDIVNGAIFLGKKLPSKRATAEKFGCSVITVEHAYELLVSEGYVESEERKGYFVTYTKGEIFVSGNERERIKPVMGFHKDENMPFSELAKTYRYVLSEYGEQLLEKSENFGTETLKTAIKKYLERNRGIIIDANQIIIGSGAEYLYGMVIEFFGKDVVYAIEDPSYKQIENVYKTKGVKIARLSLKNDGISSEELQRTSASILHVTPYRSFPTGISATASKKAEYINWASKRDGFIIEDDYDSEFSLNGKITDTIFSMDKNGKVIYINSFTKTICKSMRVGYMIVPKSLLNSFTEKMGFYSCTVPTLEQFVVASLLNEGSFERHINKVRRARRKNLLRVK